MHILKIHDRLVMGDITTNHYEQQLYSMFKTFDVDNKEALNRRAVLNLCDALQLEERGAALVDTLFERRSDRVTFTQFRNGLLSVLGGAPEPTPGPDSEPESPISGQPTSHHSDDDSSGREVAPKFVFGSKKYGRRSRPQRPGASSEASPSPRAASDSRVAKGCNKNKRPTKCKRSISVSDNNKEKEICGDLDVLDHSKYINLEKALTLCGDLQMDNIDTQVVEQIFDTSASEMTVGEFFERLNVSLATSIATSSRNEDVVEGSIEEPTSWEVFDTNDVIEAWEAAGVPQPRRLLASLGFSASSVQASHLGRILDEELHALAPHEDPTSVLPLAALALARLRVLAFHRHANALTAERDKLRIDLADANRRAQMLALEVDESHARIESELKGSIRVLESQHTEAMRIATAQLNEERERVTTLRSSLETEATARLEAETKLEALSVEVRECSEASDRRAAEADERASAAERDCIRMTAELHIAEERRLEAETAAAGGAEMARCVEELRQENVRLRDRCDELCAQLEARTRAECHHHSPPLCTSLREEAVAAGEVNLGLDSLPISTTDDLEACVVTSNNDDGRVSVCCSPVSPGVGGASAEVERGEAEELRRRLADAEHAHQRDKLKLMELVKDLEISLEQMKVEYEKCEEYWSTKLEEEREAYAEEQRASDERLNELVGKIGDYERQFGGAGAGRGALPAIDERRALEAQYEELERELQRARAECASGAAERAALLEEMTRARARACGRGCGGARGAGAALRARLGAAEGAVARLQARLHAADLLVKDLYIENCQLAHARATCAPL